MTLLVLLIREGLPVVFVPAPSQRTARTSFGRYQMAQLLVEQQRHQRTNTVTGRYSVAAGFLDGRFGAS